VVSDRSRACSASLRLKARPQPPFPPRVKTFAAWLEEALQREPTGSATPVSTNSEQPAIEAFERLISAFPEFAPSLVAQAPWAEELGVELPCDVDAVKRAFRRLAFRTHPDRTGGSHAAFLRAQELLEEARLWLEGADTRSKWSPLEVYTKTAMASAGTMCPTYA